VYSSLWIGNPSQSYGAYKYKYLIDIDHIWHCHMGSNSVTCHPTQVNAPSLNPSHAEQYSIYLPQRDGRLS